MYGCIRLLLISGSFLKRYHLVLSFIEQPEKEFMWEKIIDLSKKIITPVDIKGWISNILIAIPRIIGGLLLTIDFGGSKFGMPWTDSEKNLSLFQVAPWFPEDVAKFGIPFSIAPVFLAWMAAASEAIGGLFLVLGLKTTCRCIFNWMHDAGCDIFSKIRRGNMEYASCYGISLD